MRRLVLTVAVFLAFGGLCRLADAQPSPTKMPAWPGAADLLNRAADAATQLPSARARAFALLEIGALQAASSDATIRATAAKTLDQALDAVGKLEGDESRQRPGVLWRVAVAKHRLGDADAAVKLLADARQHAEAVTSKDSREASLCDVAIAYGMIGDKEKAAETLATAWKPYEQNPPPSRISRLIGIANYVRYEDGPLSLLPLLAAEAVLPSVLNNADRELRLFHVAAGFAKSGELEKAQALGASLKTAVCRAGFQAELAIGQAAAGDFASALATAEKIAEESDKQYALLEIGRQQATAGNPDEAEKSAGKLTVDRMKADVFRLAAMTHGQKGDIVKGLATLERAATMVRGSKDREGLKVAEAELHARYGDVAAAEKAAADLPPTEQSRLAAVIAAAHATRGDIAAAKATGTKASSSYARFTVRAEVAKALARTNGPDSPALRDWIDADTDPSVRVKAMILAAEAVIGDNPLVKGR